MPIVGVIFVAAAASASSISIADFASITTTAAATAAALCQLGRLGRTTEVLKEVRIHVNVRGGLLLFQYINHVRKRSKTLACVRMSEQDETKRFAIDKRGFVS